MIRRTFDPPEWTETCSMSPVNRVSYTEIAEQSATYAQRIMALERELERRDQILAEFIAYYSEPEFRQSSELVRRGAYAVLIALKAKWEAK